MKPASRLSKSVQHFLIFLRKKCKYFNYVKFFDQDQHFDKDEDTQ